MELLATLIWVKRTDGHLELAGLYLAAKNINTDGQGIQVWTRDTGRGCAMTVNICSVLEFWFPHFVVCIQYAVFLSFQCSLLNKFANILIDQS